VKIILGLGNPGPRYRDTRHNIGFMVVDRLAGRADLVFPEEPEGDLEAWTAEGRYGGETIFMAKPAGFMNRSGIAGRKLIQRYRVQAKNLLVVYDDADLSFGKIRIRPGGGAGRASGGRSPSRRNWQPRTSPGLRIGVSGKERDGTDLADYVLSPFDADESSRLGKILERASDAAEAWMGEGTTAVMNRFNGMADSGFEEGSIPDR